MTASSDSAYSALQIQLPLSFAQQSDTIIITTLGSQSYNVLERSLIWQIWFE